MVKAKSAFTYVYALALSKERVTGQNSLRIEPMRWIDLLNMGHMYVAYIGISGLMPSDRLSKHQSKSLYALIGEALNMDIDNKSLVMHLVLDDDYNFIEYNKEEWPLIDAHEKNLIKEFYVKFGHEPILQTAGPDSGLKQSEWLKMKKELGLIVAPKVNP